MSLGPGKRTDAWDEARAELKLTFAICGITTCELRYGGCWYNNALGFAHAVKRRFLSKGALVGMPEHIMTVILACSSCHNCIEGKPNMKEIVMRTISQRAQTKS